MTLTTPKRLLRFNIVSLGLLVCLSSTSWSIFAQESTSSTTSQLAEPDISYFDQVAPQFWQEVTPLLKAWGKAWADQDIDVYLSSYSPRFITQKGQSYTQWAKSRRVRFSRASDININIDEVRLVILSDNRVDVIFNQRYQDERYSDFVQKSLQLEKTDGQWLIIGERQLKKL